MCPEPIPLDVVYGDDDVLVVNKVRVNWSFFLLIAHNFLLQ